MTLKRLYTSCLKKQKLKINRQPGLSFKLTLIHSLNNITQLIYTHHSASQLVAKAYHMTY